MIKEEKIVLVNGKYLYMINPPWYIQAHDGFVLLLKISPSSKKTQIISFAEKAPWVKIAIHAPPEKGKANHELCSFLSDLFDLPMKDVTLMQGSSSSQKRVFIGKKIPYSEILQLFSTR